MSENDSDVNEAAPADAGEAPTEAAAPKKPLIGPDVDIRRLILVALVCIGGVAYVFWEDVRDIVKSPEIVEPVALAEAFEAENEVAVTAGALDITFNKAGAAITGLAWSHPSEGYTEQLVSQEGLPNRALVVELPDREAVAHGLFSLESNKLEGGVRTLVFKKDDFDDKLVITKTFRIHTGTPMIELVVEITGIPIGDAMGREGYRLLISNAVGLPDELDKDDPLVTVRSDRIADHHPVRRVSGERQWPNEDERKRAGHAGVEGVPTLEWVATASKYFALIARPDEPMRGAGLTFVRTAKAGAAVSLNVVPRAATDQVKDTFHIYAGPKDYDALEKLPGRMQESIDYWYFGREATLLLKLIHGRVIANYGLAIIIVTIIFRLLMWPVTRINLRSMVRLKLANAKLADIDAREPPRAADDAKEWIEELLPLVEAGATDPGERRRARTEWLRDQLAAGTEPDELRRLLDDDDARLGWVKEMRAEWLKGARVWEKVQSRATLGAFLPMLILLPILLVLYYALNAGYEFYRQPFMLWITDISRRDPIFLLPVLMGLAMMGQFRMMIEDPSKERSWIIMPVAFTIIFAFFSAGLVLFWFVDTLAGWGQLAIIKMGKKDDGAPEPAPEPEPEPDTEPEPAPESAPESEPADTAQA